MKTAKKSYHFIYDLLEDQAPEFISSLTEEEKDIIKATDAYEYNRYDLCGDVVQVFDGWEEGSWNYMSAMMGEILHDAREYVESEKASL